MLSDQILVCRRPEVAWRVIDGEAVVVNPKAGMVYPFNPVATRFWELADGKHTLSQILQTVKEEFEAPAETIEQDMIAFFEDLEKKGFIIVEEIQAAV